MKKVIIVILTTIFFLTTIFVSFDLHSKINWHNSDYTIEWNEKRKSLNIPIIESYFIPKYQSKGVHESQVWISNQKSIHISKYVTVLDHEISGEIDFFESLVENKKIKSDYNYLTDEMIIILLEYKDNELIIEKNMSLQEVDSVLKHWGYN